MKMLGPLQIIQRLYRGNQTSNSAIDALSSLVQSESGPCWVNMYVMDNPKQKVVWHLIMVI